jgi:hypothetical protein
MTHWGARTRQIGEFPVNRETIHCKENPRHAKEYSPWMRISDNPLHALGFDYLQTG